MREDPFPTGHLSGLTIHAAGSPVTESMVVRNTCDPDKALRSEADTAGPA